MNYNETLEQWKLNQTNLMKVMVAHQVSEWTNINGLLDFGREYERLCEMVHKVWVSDKAFSLPMVIVALDCLWQISDSTSDITKKMLEKEVAKDYKSLKF